MQNSERKIFRKVSKLLKLKLVKCKEKNSEVPIIRPPIVHVESGLYSEQVSLIRPFNIEKWSWVLKQVVLIARMVIISRGLYSGILL